jgi:hypothetical protein
MRIDPPTLYLAIVAAAAITAGLLWLLARQPPTREAARSWAFAFASLSVYFAMVLAAGSLPSVIGIGVANGLAIGVLGAMDRSARVLCRQPYRLWRHLAAAVVVTIVVITFLLDPSSGYDTRVQLVGSVTALQCMLIAATLNRRDHEAGNEEMLGRRALAAAFIGLGAMQVLRVVAHSPVVRVSETAILAQTPLSAGVASGFLIWTITVPVMLFRIHEARARMTLRATVSELRDTLAEVKRLQGLLPICMHCKKIRDEEGAWQPLEKYISTRTDARFSHGLCPTCLEQHYPTTAG